MKSLSISAMNEIYFCRQEIEIRAHNVEHLEYKVFYDQVKKFERALGEDSSERYWNEFLRKIKRYRFDLCAAPLPINWRLNEILDWARKHLRLCLQMYPYLSSPAQELVQSLQRLDEFDNNPILDRIIKLRRQVTEPKMAMLLKEARLVPTVEEILAKHPSLGNMVVLNPYQIRNSVCYDRLIMMALPLNCKSFHS